MGMKYGWQFVMLCCQQVWEMADSLLCCAANRYEKADSVLCCQYAWDMADSLLCCAANRYGRWLTVCCVVLPTHMGYGWQFVMLCCQQVWEMADSLLCCAANTYEIWLTVCSDANKFLFVCLIWFFKSHQQSFSYVRTGLPGLNQTTKLGLICLAQRHNAVTPVRLEPAAPRSQVKHPTTEPLRSHERYGRKFSVYPMGRKDGWYSNIASNLTVWESVFLSNIYLGVHKINLFTF